MWLIAELLNVTLPPVIVPTVFACKLWLRSIFTVESAPTVTLPMVTVPSVLPESMFTKPFLISVRPDSLIPMLPIVKP